MVFLSVSVVGIETLHIVTIVLGLELAYWLRHASDFPHSHKKVWDDTVTWIDVIKKLTLCQESSYVSLYRKCGSGDLFFNILSKLKYTLLVDGSYI